MSGGTGSGEGKGHGEEPISPILVLPDPPKPARPRSRLLVAAGATSLLALAGASLLLTNQPEDGRALRQAAMGELEASGGSDFEFSAPAVEPDTATEDPAPSPEPTAAPRLRGGTERPAGTFDDLGLARREVADKARGFDRLLAEFEGETAGCQELADAYRGLDRAFVRFSTLLAQAGRPPSEADGRLFEIVDQESAAFDRSGCPRPS